MTMRIGVLITCAAIASTVSLVSPARAQSPAMPAQDEAAALYKRGNDLYDQKKLPEAEAAYLQAWALRKTFDLATNLGAVELELGKPREAAGHLSYALANFPVGGKAAAREQIESRLKLATDQVGALRVRVNLPGARITIDGQEREPSAPDQPIFVDAGDRVVEASLAGHDSARQKIRVEKGSTQEVTLTLVPSADHGTTGAGPMWPVYVGAGATVVAVGLGVAFTVIAGGQAGDADARRDQLQQAGARCNDGCEELKTMYGDADASYNVATALYVAGGALALGTVAYAVLRPTGADKTKSAVRAVPAVSGSYAGLSLLGSF